MNKRQRKKLLKQAGLIAKRGCISKIIVLPAQRFLNVPQRKAINSKYYSEIGKIFTHLDEDGRGWDKKVCQEYQDRCELAVSNYGLTGVKQ